MLDKKQIEDNKVFSRTYIDFFNKFNDDNESRVKSAILRLINGYLENARKYEDHLKIFNAFKNNDDIKDSIIKYQFEVLYRNSVDILKKNLNFLNSSDK